MASKTRPVSKASKAGRYSSEDIHRALFPAAPRRRSVEELKEGIRTHIRKRHARR